MADSLAASSGILSFKPEYHGPIGYRPLWQPAQADTDTVAADAALGLGKFPARGMILSLAVPGLGQWYAGARLKSLLFVAAEAAAWGLQIQLSRRAEDKRDIFQAFAREHWDLEQWLLNTPTLFQKYPDVTCDGTHNLTVLLENGSWVSSDSLCGGWIDGASVVPNQEYYENIGKYDQFVAGWDDLYDDQGNPNWKEVKKTVGDSVEILIMTPRRESYRDMRDDYNQAFQLGKYALSAIMFNHLVSALDAFLETRRRSGIIPGVETSIRLDYSPYYRHGIGGATLSFAW